MRVPPKETSTPRSIGLLIFHPKYPMILPHVDDDDVEMEIVEQILDCKDSEDTDVNMQDDISGQVGNLEVTGCVTAKLPLDSSEESPVVKSSTLSGSPITNDSNSRQSFSMSTASQKDHLDKSCPKSFNDRLSTNLDRGAEVINKDTKRSAWTQSADSNMQLVPKAVEKVLAGAIRREMALKELCTRQDSEIKQLNRLLQQYKHERECNLIIEQIREDKICRLESWMDGVLSTVEFKDNELLSLKYENKMLKENYESQPEVLRTEIEFKRYLDELEGYQNFFDLGERDILLEEVEDLKTLLQLFYTKSSTKKKSNILKTAYLSAGQPINLIQGSADQRFKAESKWISLVEDLQLKLQQSHFLVEKLKHELDTERKCAKELKDAMEGHARILEEQYADLEGKYIKLLTTQWRTEDGITDVTNTKAGVKGAEHKFIDSLAAEMSVLKAEIDKERCYYREESNGLNTRLMDTGEAVMAVGDLLVRLKEVVDDAEVKPDYNLGPAPQSYNDPVLGLKTGLKTPGNA